MWKGRSIESEVAKGGAEGGIGHGQSNDESKGKNAVDQNPAVYGLACKFCVEMKRLWVLRQRGKQQVVGFGHRPTRFVLKC